MEKQYEEYAYVLDFLATWQTRFSSHWTCRISSGRFDSMRRRRVLHASGSLSERRV